MIAALNRLIYSDCMDAMSGESLDKLQSTDILVTEPALLGKHSLLYKLPNLKWMQSTWAGVDQVFKDYDQRKVCCFTFHNHPFHLFYSVYLNL